MTPFQNVRLETGRLVLRSFALEDAEAFYQAIQDPEMYKTLPEDHMYDRAEVGEIVEYFVGQAARNVAGRVGKFPLLVLEKATGAVVGDVGIGSYGKDESRTEIFYCANSAYWGRGYMSEAVACLLDYVRRHGLADRLVGDVVRGNTASARILLKNGFVRIGEDEAAGSELFELRLA